MECYFAWNFGNLTGYPGTTKVTVEWRQPPGVTTVGECLAWTELAVGFFQAARGWADIGTEIESLYGPDVDGLKRFMTDRGEYPGRDFSAMDDIFRGKSGSVKAAGFYERVDYPLAYDRLKELDS